jgi:hypothetical protein
MESNNSSLREVLNNIAIIQHDLANDQTQLLDSEILVQLKGLAARLYLESDIELISMTMETPEVVEEVPVTPVIEMFAPEIEPVVESIFEAIPEPTPEPEPEPEPEPIPEPEVVVPEPEPVVIPEPVVEVVPVPEPEPVAVVIPEPPVVEQSAKSTFTVEGIIAQMPLSRRFEFANILFGGDMQNMGMFIQQFIDAPNAEGRLDVYDRWYEEKQWRRRDESASDMLRMLKRIFAS